MGFAYLDNAWMFTLKNPSKKTETPSGEMTKEETEEAEAEAETETEEK